MWRVHLVLVFGGLLLSGECPGAVCNLVYNRYLEGFLLILRA